MKTDIITRDDVKKLVDSFYDRVNRDPLLAPIFNDVAKVHWETHLPVMYEFWGSLLIGEGDFRGRPYPKHAVLPVEQEHFERWLELFRATVEAHFVGEKAEEAKWRALCIADTFSMRMGVLRQPEALRAAIVGPPLGK